MEKVFHVFFAFRGFCAIAAVYAVLAYAAPAPAWEQDGGIPGTDIEYSGLTVSKNGVSVKLTNASSDDVRVSLRLMFFDKSGALAGYSIFGLREIKAGASAEALENYLSGKWKSCRDSVRIGFSKMTYEPIYEQRNDNER